MLWSQIPRRASLNIRLTAATLLMGWTGAIAPAVAKPINEEIYVDFYGSNSFETVLDEARATSQKTVANAFSQDPLVSEVNVVFMGERNGNLIPIVSLTVTRSQWMTNPGLAEWEQFFAGSRTLLGFNNFKYSRSRGSSTVRIPRGSLTSAERIDD